MLGRSALAALLAAWVASAAPAAEGPKKPKQPVKKPPASVSLPAKPSADELDKPGEAAISSPFLLPGKSAATKDDKPAEPRTTNPFGRRRSRKPKYAVPCRITYSDGKVVEGHAWRRTNRPIRIFNRAKREHQDYFLSDLKRIDVKPKSVNFERDWRWKHWGSSVKVTLKTGYYWNEYSSTFTTTDGERAVGDCSGQFYLLPLEGKRTIFILYKRQSGREFPHKLREELEPLVYIRSIAFTDDIGQKDPARAPEPAEKKKTPKGGNAAPQ